MTHPNPVLQRGRGHSDVVTKECSARYAAAVAQNEADAEEIKALKARIAQLEEGRKDWRTLAKRTEKLAHEHSELRKQNMTRAEKVIPHDGNSTEKIFKRPDTAA